MEGTGAEERGKVIEDEWIFSTATLYFFRLMVIASTFFGRLDNLKSNQLYKVQAPISLQQLNINGNIYEIIYRVGFLFPAAASVCLLWSGHASQCHTVSFCDDDKLW